MAITTESMTSTTALERPNARIALSAVVSGTLLAIACLALVVLIGAAVFASAALEGVSLGSHRGLVWAIGIGAATALGSFIGARFAAINARAVVRRDGLLAGLLTWALLVLAVALALGITIAVKRPTWPALPALSAYLWNSVFTLAGALLAALLGGVRGARSEARAIGLRSVKTPVFTPYHQVDLDAYERGFFAEPSDQPGASTSLPA
jgi:hypothetical protein